MGRTPKLTNRTTSRSTFAVGNYTFECATTLAKYSGKSKQAYIGEIAAEIASGKYDYLITPKNEKGLLGIKGEDVAPALKHLIEINAKESFRELLETVIQIKFNEANLESPAGEKSGKQDSPNPALVQRENKTLIEQVRSLQRELANSEHEKMELEREKKKAEAELRKIKR